MRREAEHHSFDRVSRINTSYFYFTAKMEIINSEARKSYLPRKTLKELVVGEKYKVTRIKKVDTKYGEKVVLELASFQLFLPKALNVFLITNDDAYKYLELQIDTREVFMESMGGAAIKFI